MKIAVTIFLSFFSIQVFAQKLAWDEMSLLEKASILGALDEIHEDDLPVESKIIIYGSDTVSIKFMRIDEINGPSHQAFAEQMLKVFSDEVSREEIEQSYYQPYGEPRLTLFALLLDETGEILGGKMSMYQDGRDENGEEGDISWQASVRFDKNAEVFLDQRGQAFDELRFEWSGH